MPDLVLLRSEEEHIQVIIRAVAKRQTRIKASGPKIRSELQKVCKMNKDRQKTECMPLSRSRHTREHTLINHAASFSRRGAASVTLACQNASFQIQNRRRTRFASCRYSLRVKAPLKLATVSCKMFHSCGTAGIAVAERPDHPCLFFLLATPDNLFPNATVLHAAFSDEPGWQGEC